MLPSAPYRDEITSRGAAKNILKHLLRMFWSVSSGLEETKLPRDSKTGGSLRTREDEREGGGGHN